MAEPEPTASSKADRSAIVALAQRVVYAWSSHDADKFAEWFVEDATMILPGVFCDGREEIRAHMAAEFGGDMAGCLLTGQPLALRFLNRDTAILISEGGVLAPGEIEVTADRAVRATWLAVKHRGRWRFASYQNSPRH